MKATLLTDKRISKKTSRQEGIINYDDDNAYPQRVTDILNSSATGSLCHNLAVKFIVGNGFADSQFYKSKLNSKGLTADKLLRKVADNLKKFNGVAIHINYNALYQKTSYNFIPFEWCRLTSEESNHPNKLAVYDDWQKIEGRINKDNIEYLDFFNDNPAIIEQQVQEAGGWDNYKGQVYYYTTVGKSYPLSPIDSILEDMQTDAKTKLFKYRNVSTNFMASHFIEVNEFESDEERNEFESQLADFQGADDALKMMLVERKATEESAIEIKKVDIQNVERLYEYTETSVRDSIIRNYLIPPVLLLQTAGKMGTSKEILDAVNYYNGVVDYEQLIIEEIFTDLFKNSVIKNDGNFSIISLKAQVETTEVINLIANTNLTIDQKISSLTLLYGFTKEEAINLSGI
jgi:hypothetical protein